MTDTIDTKRRGAKALQKALNRERVRRYRHRQAERGRVRVEVYLDQEILDAVSRCAEDWEEGLNVPVKNLILSDQRVEKKVPTHIRGVSP